jgi:hypothetical protein
MDRLGRQVESELGRLTPTGSSDMVAIVRAWPDAVGAENARRAWPARLARDGTLIVHATDSVWAFQLGMLAAAILERLRGRLGATTPAAVRFVPGPVPEPAAEDDARAAPPLVEVGAEDDVRAAALAAAIDDDELRATVARAAAASLARARREAVAEPRSDRHF